MDIAEPKLLSVEDEKDEMQMIQTIQLLSGHVEEQLKDLLSELKAVTNQRLKIQQGRRDNDEEAMTILQYVEQVGMLHDHPHLSADDCIKARILLKRYLDKASAIKVFVHQGDSDSEPPASKIKNGEKHK